MPVLTQPAGERVIRRAYPAAGGLELREAQDGSGELTVIGHAAVFDRTSLPLYDFFYGEFRERIAPGAFRNVLDRDPDVHLVLGHNMAAAPLARTRSRTLELREDPRGLRAYARIDGSRPDVLSVASAMRRGDMDQMSFAFSVERDEWLVEEGPDGEAVTRTILEIRDLYDVSLVPQGAYPQTDASIRALVQGAIDSGRLALGAGADHRAGQADPAGAETMSAISTGDERVGDLARQRARQSRKRRLALIQMKR
jgi:hypothetical protein